MAGRLAVYFCALLLVVGSTASCAPTGPSEKEPGECDVQSDEPVVEFATGKGSAYHVMEDGEELQLVFGSQAGMEARVVVQSAGVPMNAITYSEVELLVDDYPIAQMTILGEDCTCDETLTKMNAPMLVDVVPHPTVKSVLQLSGREAQLVVRVFGESGVMQTATTNIILLS